MRLNSIKVYFLFIILLLAACGSKKVGAYRSSDGTIVDQKSIAEDHLLSGDASYYADRFNGRTTASGDEYDSQKMTAAHRTLPFGAIVRVVDPATNRSVEVRINDRGPFTKGRVIDLSGEAARELDMIRAGIVYVEIQVLELP